MKLHLLLYVVIITICALNVCDGLGVVGEEIRGVSSHIRMVQHSW